MSKQNIAKLKSITLNGFKSFNGDDHTIEFGETSVIIGTNGAGKSNLVSFFKMIDYMMINAFQQYIGEQGGASPTLYDGPKVTSKMSAKLVFSDGDYYFSLVPTAQESLIFSQEILSFQDEYKEVRQIELSVAGAKESGLGLSVPKLKDFIPVKNIYTLLKKCRVYQFHDTSSTAGIRRFGYINQNDLLYGDGSNLAAFLYGLKENEKYRHYYDKIIRHIKRVFPQFGDFDLQPNVRNENYIALDWYEQNNTKYKFGAYQLSDGTIRFMALATLLLQPPKTMPSLIIIDEPELGLHPSAIVELACMVKMASQHAQIILATQCPELLDEFSPEQITVIERDPITKSSVFKKYSEEYII